MKKIILLTILAIVLVSCGKIPESKLALATYCLDSLKQEGAMNSFKFAGLQDRLVNANEEIEVQKTKLFKKFDVVNKVLDDVITDSRRFIITNDRPIGGITPTSVMPNGIIPNGTNVVRLEVLITFDNNPDALKIASTVDDAIRRNVNSNAKLISVKIIQ